MILWENKALGENCKKAEPKEEKERKEKKGCLYVIAYNIICFFQPWCS